MKRGKVKLRKNYIKNGVINSKNLLVGKKIISKESKAFKRKDVFIYWLHLVQFFVLNP